MYTTQKCGDCMKVKAFFEANHISFLQIGIEDNDLAKDFVAKVNRGFYSVPTIIFPDGSILTEPTWKELRNKIPS